MCGENGKFFNAIEDEDEITVVDNGLQANVSKLVTEVISEDQVDICDIWQDKMMQFAKVILKLLAIILYTTR
jgi:hypothetical protein